MTCKKSSCYGLCVFFDFGIMIGIEKHYADLAANGGQDDR